MKKSLLILVLITGFFVSANSQRITCDYKVVKTKELKDFVTFKKTYILDLDLIKRQIKIYDNGDTYTIKNLDLLDEDRLQWVFVYQEKKILIITKNFDSFYFGKDTDTYMIYFKSNKLLERYDK